MGDLSTTSPAGADKPAEGLSEAQAQALQLAAATFDALDIKGAEHLRAILAQQAKGAA